jgi:prevent-host-death family protein
MLQPTDIHPLTEFKRDSTRFIDALEAKHRPVVLTVDGRPKVVLLDVVTFERMADLVDRVETIEGIRRGIEDFKAGRTMSLDAFGADLRQGLGLDSKA